MMVLAAKIVMIILGFWIPSVLLDALQKKDPEEAQSAREKLCVGCGAFVILLMFLIGG